MSLCSSRKHPYPRHGRSLEIPRGRGSLKVKSLEAKYEAKLEFPGGRGMQNKKPSVGGVWIFSGTVNSILSLIFTCLCITKRLLIAEMKSRNNNYFMVNY